MKITNQNIQDLYKFTRQHYVEHYDVQTELVDHLANDIEEIWKENPSLSFIEARDKSFKKFGIFGFMDVVEKKQKELSKKYWKILWGFTKEWFQIPKIFLTISMILFFYFTIQTSISEYIIWSIFLIVIIYGSVKYYKLRSRFNKKKRKWMMENILLIQGNSFILVLAQYPIHILNFNSEYNGDYITILVSLIIVLIFITVYITLEIIPKKAEQFLEETYPEYKIVNSL